MALPIRKQLPSSARHTLPQLADKMFLCINTIRDYLQKLNIKRNAHNTAQLLQNAKALKLV